MSRARLRPLDAPRPVRVETDPGGLPLAAWIPRRKAVSSIRESWRVDDEWWRRAISRAYHTVVLEDGRLVTLFEDLESGGWYLHG